ncbi:ABC transporter permease [Mucilaginibacter auburnensis]|uniref:Putative ABC transport system permease protein n=1 Tax=Mucilaginibacter auburnensis TaxID=1457233 RepID=A0A2H9VT49_9SPHI|nr:ABC transporter permease [Mucilaginibacter auburnensis]PJJ84003.1 putative ABC transport system permease protein [Mucilaginibacter auburnensis]
MPVKTTFRENVSIALQSIAGNRLRTSLTALIIAIGIMALVGILTAVEGIKQYTTDAFSSLGANSFTIQNRGSGIRFGGGRRKVYPAIRYDQAARFRDKFKLPSTIAINLNVSSQAVAKYASNKTNPNVSITGSNENYVQTNGYKIALGRNFSDAELEHGANVVIIGEEVKDKLFKKEDPINKSIFVGSNKFRVIGVFAPKGSSAGFGGDRLCLIPILKAKQITTVANPSFSIAVMVNGPGSLDLTTGEATSLFRNIRSLNVAAPDNFEIVRSDSIQQQLSGQITGMTIAGFGIGIITLLGAAIGLMNIMLVSVTERTREIGVRKAIGATPGVIRKQFLIEAVVICIIGGIGGMILGMAIGNLIAVSISGKFVIPWLWLFSAFALCTFIGLASGFYPAKKASNLDPVEALRYE